MNNVKKIAIPLYLLWRNNYRPYVTKYNQI